MKQLYFVIVVLCLVGIGYGYWGAFTQSGQYYYDEMDAMKPFFVMVGSSFMLIVLTIARIIKKVLKK